MTPSARSSFDFQTVHTFIRTSLNKWWDLFFVFLFKEGIHCYHIYKEVMVQAYKHRCVTGGQLQKYVTASRSLLAEKSQNHTVVQR